jgi:hypothetical protein
MEKNCMFPQKRFVVFVIMVGSLLFSLACQSVSKILVPETSPSNNTPELPLNSTAYDGNWRGTTSQDFEVTFTVAHNGIVALKVQGNWEGPNCSRNFETNVEVTVDPAVEALGIPATYPINNDTFTIAEDGSNTDGTAYTFVGTFLSAQKASGTIEYVATSGSCQGAQKFDWTAVKFSN